MKDFNPLLRVRAVFTQVSTHPQNFRQSQAQEILTDYPEITVLETRVHQRAAYDIHVDDPEFGYRLITDELKDQGFTVSERRVWRVCSVNRIWCVFGKGKAVKPRPGPPTHQDLLHRALRPGKPVPCQEIPPNPHLAQACRLDGTNRFQRR